MAQKLKFGNGTWATKKGSTLAYNDENNNYKPLPFTTTRNSIATRVNKQGLIEVVGNDVPRIDYTDSADGVLLLENSATNVIINSEDFTGSEWVLFGVGTGVSPIVTSNYATSPDGTQNATRIQFNLNGGTLNTDRSFIRYSSFASQTDYYYSCYVKSANGQEQKLLWQHGGDDSEFTVTNEWQRVELDRNGNAETFTGFSLRGGISTVDSADVLIWGFQVERNSVATSYIPTSGSSVTRQADTASESGNSEVYGNNGGVLFWNAKAFDNMGNLALTGSNGTNAERFQLYFDTTTSDRIKSNVVTGNVAIAPMQSQVLDVTTFHKCANSFANNNHALWVDGFKVDTDTSGGVSQGVDRLNFDNGTGTSDFYGSTKEIAYYDTALTDAELEVLTSYETLTELVTELNLNTL